MPKNICPRAAHAERRSRACDDQPRRRWLRIIVGSIAERRGRLLLLLAATEKEIKQAFCRTHFRRQLHGGNNGLSNKHAAQLAQKGQFGMQGPYGPRCSTSGR